MDQASLFESADSNDEPLASRLRPRNLDEYIGQDHIIGHGRLLRRAIQADQLSSVIFSGPPGTGKTTLARVIANSTKSYFISLNAVLAGVKEIREAISEAQDRKRLHGRRTILFVDEVHRWSKSQQDALLPWVENGTIILIGATTENPFFEVNKALVSRSRIFQLKPLERADLHRILDFALSEPNRGFGGLSVELSKEARDHFVEVCDGDARSLLNALELAVTTTLPNPDTNTIFVDLATAEESIQERAVLYDKEGDYHFDTISAFIKSIRGSDPDAALFWLARMVQAGESPRFIFRRMLISAAEDVGLADPQALSIVESAAAAFERVGLPEGQFFLSEAALYLAGAPKSNSTMGYFDALAAQNDEGSGEVPNHLKDASRDTQGFGHGQGYLYPHAFRDHWTAQDYLPDGLRGRVFYQPGSLGWEGGLAKLIEQRREIVLSTEPDAGPGESLTYSPQSPGLDSWIRRVDSLDSDALRNLRTEVFDAVPITRSSRVLIAGNSAAMFLWESLRRCPEGLTCAVIPNADLRNRIAAQLSYKESLVLPRVFAAFAGPDGLDRELDSQVRFDIFLSRNSDWPDREVFEAWAAPAAVLGDLSLDPATSAPLSQVLPDLSSTERSVVEKIESAIEHQPLPIPPGARELENRAVSVRQKRRVSADDVHRWFPREEAATGAFGNAALASTSREERDELRKSILARTVGQLVSWEFCYRIRSYSLT